MLNRMRTSLSQMGINVDKRNLIIPISFALPILILYVLDPHSFEIVWKGRAPLLLFLWFLLLELALGWKKLVDERSAWTWFRIAGVTVAATAPTIYVVSAFFFGVKDNIWELGELLGATVLMQWPISFEYVLFTVFFVASVGLMWKIEGFKMFSISFFFIGATSFFNIIDTFYPEGTISVLQAFALFIASCVVRVLNWIGYNTQLAPYSYKGMPILHHPGLPPLAIGWPCIGVQSLFIYTFVILLFLKGSPFTLQKEIVRAAIPKRLKSMTRSERISFLLKRRTIRATIAAGEKFVINFFEVSPLFIIVVVGAIGTFIVNVLRIVTLCIIGSHTEMEVWYVFHSYLGELFFIAWIIIYLSTIFYSHKLLAKLSILGAKLTKTGRRFSGVKER